MRPVRARHVLVNLRGLQRYRVIRVERSCLFPDCGTSGRLRPSLLRPDTCEVYLRPSRIRRQFGLETHALTWNSLWLVSSSYAALCCACAMVHAYMDADYLSTCLRFGGAAQR
ncbi:hypothetical protein GY45DRAFT_19360 [Cubamyces sp. BRFM 1775]|nr:hypothetical protein GY45DRAFT_19360 [Cubamyces sp. BRFM 1775]